MKKVATRFAPSPTGPLHIGGVRTALFNWLYSKNQNGNFYLQSRNYELSKSDISYNSFELSPSHLNYLLLFAFFLLLFSNNSFISLVYFSAKSLGVSPEKLTGFLSSTLAIMNLLISK